MSLFRHHGYLAGCFSYVQDWPKTRLTKTNVKTDKSYSVVCYDVLFKNNKIRSCKDDITFHRHRYLCKTNTNDRPPQLICFWMFFVNTLTHPCYTQLHPRYTLLLGLVSNFKLTDPSWTICSFCFLYLSTTIFLQIRLCFTSLKKIKVDFFRGWWLGI